MTAWRSPLPGYDLIPTHDSDSFASFPSGSTGLPLFPHKGAFAVPRKFHTHEGVDLYAPDGTPVTAVEEGIVVDIQPFTGLHANTPWWNDTWAVLVEGETGVVVYGEVRPIAWLYIGSHIRRNSEHRMDELIGHVSTVLKVDKGRPMSMLHLELHANGTRGEILSWEDRFPPATLRDPTPYLLNAEG